MNLRSQVSDRDTIIQLIELNKTDCPIQTNYYQIGCIYRWMEIFKRIQNNFFKPDSILMHYFLQNEDYIMFRDRKTTFVGVSMEMDEVLKRKNGIYQDYILSLSFKDSSFVSKLDFALKHDKRRWIKILTKQLSIEDIIVLFNEREEKSGILINMFDDRNLDDWLIFYSNVLTSLRTKIPTYGTFISLITEKKNSQLDSIFIIEKSYFENNRDTTNSLHNFIWDHKFTRNAIVRDSIKNAEWEKEKAIRNDSIREAMLKEQLEPPTEEEYLSTLDSTKKVEYFASKDTTLWYEGYIFPGDDGTNFNSWPNESLLEKLSYLNTKLFMTIGHYNPSLFFEDISMFHLYKISQIIGDRVLNKSFLPNAKQRQFLNRFINEFSKYYCNSLHSSFELHWQSRKQLLRLWPLLNKPVLDWLVHPDTCYNILAKDLLICIFSEELVKAIIYKMDFPANKKEKSYKEIYFNALKLLYNYDETESHVILLDLPPRRPLRNARQTQDWIDRLIEPARIRHGISEVK
ncbi:MAG: hypothetical protein IPM34_14325 [Saprospiraceae bacterium]|nr:hypothetical protein [Saprospiraceae bacterium]